MPNQVAVSPKRGGDHHRDGHELEVRYRTVDAGRPSASNALHAAEQDELHRNNTGLPLLI